MIEILLAIFFALFGFITAVWLYSRSSKDLKNEAAELRKLNTAILRALENAGFAKLNRDDKGNIIGLVFDVKVHSGMHFHSSTDAKVIRRPKNSSSNNDAVKK